MHDIRRNPKLQMAAALVVFFLATVWHGDITAALFLLVFCVGLTVGIDLLISFVRHKKFIPPYAALVTGLILTLIIEPTLRWEQVALISFVAIAQKQLLRPTGRHVFNPAAVGLLAGWLVFGQHPSWWAASQYAQNVPLNVFVYLSLAGLFFVSGYKMKRQYTIGSYVLVFAVLFELFVSSISFKSFLATLMSPGNLFYAFVMLPEPMTSPVSPTRQMLYGTFVAIVSVALAYIAIQSSIALPDTSLVALLAGNALFFRFR